MLLPSSPSRTCCQGICATAAGPLILYYCLNLKTQEEIVCILWATIACACVWVTWAACVWRAVPPWSFGVPLYVPNIRIWVKYYLCSVVHILQMAFHPVTMSSATDVMTVTPIPPSPSRTCCWVICNWWSLLCDFPSLLWFELQEPLGKYYICIICVLILGGKIMLGSKLMYHTPWFLTNPQILC